MAFSPQDGGMLFGLLSLALFGSPACGPASSSVRAVMRSWVPATEGLLPAARECSPTLSRRRCRFRDFLDDEDDGDGRGRPTTPAALLPPSAGLPCAGHAFLPHPEPARRLAAVPLIYALCTLLI